MRTKKNCKGVLTKTPGQASTKKPGKNIVNVPVLRWLICSTYKHDWNCLQAILLLKEQNSNKVDVPKENSHK